MFLCPSKRSAFQFVVIVWIFRLAFVGFSIVLSIIIAIVNKDIGPSHHKFLEPTCIHSLHPIVISTDSLNGKKEYFKLFNSLREKRQTAMMKERQTIKTLLLKLLLKDILPIDATAVKLSKSNVFIHYTLGKIWSRLHNVPNELYKYISLSQYFEMITNGFNFPDYEILSKPESSGQNKPFNSSNNYTSMHYIYATYFNLNNYAEELSPIMNLILTSNKFSNNSKKKKMVTNPNLSLWLSSPSVTATLHYDLEDNYFLQLHGNKTLIIISPEAFSCIPTYSSFHPFWRQSTISGPLSATEWDQHLLKCQNLKSTKNETASKLRNRTNSGLPLNAKPVDKIKVWNLSLQSGDLVYIPAGYYHSVITESESVSMNVWLTSSINMLYDELIHLELPFLSISNFEMKLASFLQYMRQVIRLIKLDAKQFFEIISTRYLKHVNEEQMIYNCSSQYYHQHSNSTVLLHNYCSHSTEGLDPKFIHLTTSMMEYYHDIVTNQALLTMFLMDYFEDVLQVVLTSHSHLNQPCFIYDLFVSCGLSLS